MKLKRLIASLICIALLLIIIAGCSSNNTECTFPDCGPDSPTHLNVNASLAAFPHDTVMIKSGDVTLTWAELFIFLFSTVQDLIGSYGEDIPWNDEFDGFVLSDLLLEYSTADALTLLAYKYGLSSAGFTLSDEALLEFKHELDSYIEEMDGLEAFVEFLREYNGVYSLEVFENFIKLDYTIGAFADHLYGADGAGYPDDKVAEYAEIIGYDLLMATHILRLKTEDGDDTPLKEAEEILRRLRPQASSANFLEIFQAEMFEHSEDVGGVTSFPDGYLFLYDAMVPEFSEATMTLRLGEMSGIVETEYGYHIILRLPVNFDSYLMTPGNVSQLTLRQLAAGSNLEYTISEWSAFIEQNLEYTSAYNSIDLSKIFKIH